MSSPGEVTSTGGVGRPLDEDVWTPDALGVVAGVHLLRQAAPSPWPTAVLYRGLRRGQAFGRVPNGIEVVTGLAAVTERVGHDLGHDERTAESMYGLAVAGDDLVSVRPSWPTHSVGRLHLRIGAPRPPDRFPDVRGDGLGSGSFSAVRDGTRDRLWLAALQTATQVGYHGLVVSLRGNDQGLRPELEDQAGFEPLLDTARRHGFSPVDELQEVARWEARIVDGAVTFESDLCGAQPDPVEARRVLASLLLEASSSRLSTRPEVLATLRSQAASRPSGVLRGEITVAGGGGMSIADVSFEDFPALEAAFRLHLIDVLADEP